MAATDVSWRHHRKTKGAAVCEESRLIDNNNTITTCSYSFLKGKLGDDDHQDSPEPMQFHTIDEPRHFQGATTNGESGDAKCNADANTDADDDQNSQEDGDGEEYVVEKVVKRRCMETGQYFCLVKWLGYPREYDTWEPEENLISVDKHDEFMASFTQRQYLLPGTKGATLKGFDRGLQPEKILGCRLFNNRAHFSIKWKDWHHIEWVPVEDADDFCPQMVIAFYEKHISWNSKPAISHSNFKNA